MDENVGVVTLSELAPLQLQIPTAPWSVLATSMSIVELGIG
jgi:hypothetical protein